ncbi:MAG: CarD family transcriptional regulator [Desulfobacterales bacterium]
MQSAPCKKVTFSDHPLTFHPGDYVAYPAHGVGQVKKIEQREIGGNRNEFYVIEILDSESVVMVPVQNASSIGMRAIIQAEDVERVYMRIKSDRNITMDRNWNRRSRQYMNKIKSGDLYSIAEVYRDLYRLNQDKDLSFEQRKLIDMAKGLLVNEICLVKSEDEHKISEEIESLFPG